MDKDFERALIHLHQSIDRLVNELLPDRPDLAKAVRRRAARIPRPDAASEALARTRERPPRATMRHTLYDALVVGAVDGNQFDALMLQHNRATRILGDEP